MTRFLQYFLLLEIPAKFINHPLQCHMLPLKRPWQHYLVLNLTQIYHQIGIILTSSPQQSEAGYTSMKTPFVTTDCVNFSDDTFTMQAVPLLHLEDDGDFNQHQLQHQDFGNDLMQAAMSITGIYENGMGASAWSQANVIQEKNRCLTSWSIPQRIYFSF